MCIVAHRVYVNTKASLIMEVSFVILLLYVFSNGELNVLVSIQPVYGVLFLAFVLFTLIKFQNIVSQKSNSQNVMN